MQKTRYKKPDAIKRLENFAFKKQKEMHPNFPYPIKPTYKDNTTNTLTKCVFDAIELTGGFVERFNSMGNQIETNKGVKWVKGSSKKGTADLHCIIKAKSVMIEIKCKYTKDRQSLAQREYQKQIEQAGGVYLIVRDFKEFYDWYGNFLR